MKNNILGFIFFLIVMVILSCGKSLTRIQPNLPLRGFQRDTVTGGANTNPDSSALPTAPFPQAPVTGCPYSPSYGDSVVFPQPANGQDYVLRPVNNPGPGKYLSWPAGMVIDSLTGAIDITKSQTGQRYAIGFVKSGSTDTCLNTLIIGGADYLDSVYVFDNGPKKAEPYFNANPKLPSVCSNGSNSGCAFDVTGSAANQRVSVKNSTGEIDLMKTLNGTGLLGGAFGPLPFNGQMVTTTIYYRINDQSNNALQHLDVNLMYFFSKSQMNPGLLASILFKLQNGLNGNLISTSSNPRPPLIIIVRHN
jgi:hypothetical protein